MDKPMSHCSTDIATLSQNINDMLAAHGMGGSYESSSGNNDELTFVKTDGSISITLTLPAVANAAARCMMLTYFFMQLSRFFDPKEKLTFDAMKTDLENKQGAMEEVMGGRRSQPVYGLQEEIRNSRLSRP